jgi:hypothetical protein
MIGSYRTRLGGNGGRGVEHQRCHMLAENIGHEHTLLYAYVHLAELYYVLSHVKFRNYDTIHKSHIKIPHSKQKGHSISEKYHGPSRPGLYPPIPFYLLLHTFRQFQLHVSPKRPEKKIELRIIHRRKNSRQKVGLGVFGQNRKKGVSSLHTSMARKRRKWKREEYMLLDDAGKKER